MKHEEIDWLLKQWGAWSRLDGTGKLSDTASAMFVGLTTRRESECVDISDEQAMRIDYILSALNGYDHINWVIIVMAYYYNMSDSAIIKHFKNHDHLVSRPKIQARREAGAAFVAGFISN